MGRIRWMLLKGVTDVAVTAGRLVALPLPGSISESGVLVLYPARASPPFFQCRAWRAVFKPEKRSPYLMALELFETLGELGFVIQLLTFTYATFWLYLTFRDLPMLFGLSTVVVGFFVFIHGVSVTILVAGFVFLVLFGMQIQQMLWFGLFPLLGFHVAGDHLMTSEEMDPRRLNAKMQEVQERMASGEAGQGEIEWLEKHMGQQQMGGGDPAQQMRMMQARGLM